MPRAPMTDPGPPSDDAYETREVALTDIRVFRRLRPLEPGLVETLAASMKETGLLHPIAVRRTPEGYHLVLGRHRLEAARQLRWQTIRASVFFDMTADQAALAEVEGNLVSRLTPDEYENLITSQQETRDGPKTWKATARKFFGLSSRNMDA